VNFLNRKLNKTSGGVEMRKITRSEKGLSPIFAVLILVAIAVIAGIIVYMFTSGYLATMMGGGTSGQEKVAVEAVVANAANDSVIVYCKSTGGGDVIIQDVIVKSASGQTLEVATVADVTLLSDGTLGTVNCAFASADLVAGYTYTVTLVSKEGNQFVSASFKA
jgi:flagellin-like protein